MSETGRRVPWSTPVLEELRISEATQGKIKQGENNGVNGFGPAAS